MSHRNKINQANAESSESRPPQTQPRVDPGLFGKRSPKPLKPKSLPPVDPVEIASKESFPCSDPPGYGHA